MKLLTYCILALVFIAFPESGIAQQGTVTLLEAGESPRKPLRFKVKKGQTEDIKMTMKMDMEMVEMGQKIGMPAMIMNMNIQVADVQADGDITYKFTLGEASVDEDDTFPPAMIEGLKQSLQFMTGISGEATINDRGMTLAASINEVPNADPQAQQLMKNMEQTMNQISAPLPDEAVGVGAKWRYTTSVSQDGVEIRQVAEYELVARQGDTIDMKATVKQTAPSQSVADAGDEMAMSYFRSDGSGDIKLGLANLAPKQSSMALETTLVMESYGSAAPSKMTMISGMKMSITSK